ncbi:MAG: glycosyltransferase family 1 protein, partial [Planctomycetota bacterium]
MLLDGHWRPELWPAVRRFKQAGGVVVPGVHDLIALDHPETCDPLTAARFRAWLSRATQHADAFVCVSQATADRLRKHVEDQSPAPHDSTDPRCPPIVVARPGVDPPDAVAHQATELRQSGEHGPPGRVLIVGTIEPRKGHTTLLDAMERMWSHGSRCALLVVGRPGWRCDGIVDRLEGRIADGRPIRWRQDADDAALHEAYASADVLVIPSLEEGFGLSAVEALVRGLPVIASDLPAL